MIIEWRLDASYLINCDFLLLFMSLLYVVLVLQRFLTPEANSQYAILVINVIFSVIEKP